MNIWPILGALLSLVTGSLPDPTASALDGAEERDPVHAAPSGFDIEGDGFYVWDEDRREVEDWAIELAGPAFPRRS